MTKPLEPMDIYNLSIINMLYNCFPSEYDN